MSFDVFIQDLESNRWPVYGVQVYERGSLAHAYGDTKTRYPIYSCTKTILSLAVGMAMDDGKMDIYQPLMHYLPEKAVREMSEKQRAIYASLPVERLMCMSVDAIPSGSAARGTGSGKRWLIPLRKSLHSIIQTFQPILWVWQTPKRCRRMFSASWSGVCCFPLVFLTLPVNAVQTAIFTVQRACAFLWMN